MLLALNFTLFSHWAELLFIRGDVKNYKGGGGTPLTDKICKVVFDAVPNFELKFCCVFLYLFSAALFQAKIQFQLVSFNDLCIFFEKQNSIEEIVNKLAHFCQ